MYLVATEGAPLFKVVSVAVLLSRTFPPISDVSATYAGVEWPIQLFWF